MKSLFKCFGIVCLMVFSFYYTDKIAFFIQSKTEFMQKIKKNKNNLEVKSVNAIINDKYIIPGINGLVVNEQKSYLNMKVLNDYDIHYLVYDEARPSISLLENKDKIVKKANAARRYVSIVIDDYKYVPFFTSKKIKVDFLLKDSLLKNDNLEYINSNTSEYYKVEKFLNKTNNNKNLCFINAYNEKLCRENQKFLIEPTYIVNNSNFANCINEVDSGDILKIENLSVENLEFLINAILNRNLKIVYLSQLISESYKNI